MFPAFCSLPKNIEEALEKIAEWTGFVVYIFRYSLEHYEHYRWTIKNQRHLSTKIDVDITLTLQLLRKMERYMWIE